MDTSSSTNTTVAGTTNHRLTFAVGLMLYSLLCLFIFTMAISEAIKFGFLCGLFVFWTIFAYKRTPSRPNIEHSILEVTVDRGGRDRNHNNSIDTLPLYEPQVPAYALTKT